MQTRGLQDSHTVHRSPRTPLTADVPDKTSCKPPVKISALMRVSYYHREGREANQYSDTGAQRIAGDSQSKFRNMNGTKK